jgi:hypothetical protein
MGTLHRIRACSDHHTNFFASGSADATLHDIPDGSAPSQQQPAKTQTVFLFFISISSSCLIIFRCRHFKGAVQCFKALKHFLDPFIGMGLSDGINEVSVLPTVLLEKLSWIDNFAIADRHGLDQELSANSSVAVLFRMSKGLVPSLKKENKTEEQGNTTRT